MSKIVFLTLFFSVFLISRSTFAAPELSPAFDDTFYKPIDLRQYCRSNFGSSASVEFTSEHLYSAQCVRVRFARFRSNRETFPISIAEACDQQYGASYEAVATGLNRYDWTCVDWNEANQKVVPVIIVASDFFYDLAEVNAGIVQSARVFETVQDWYAQQMRGFQSKTFELLRPIIKLSDKNADQWNQASCATGSTTDSGYPNGCFAFTHLVTDRNRLINESIDEVSALFDKVNSRQTSLIVMNFVFTGTDAGEFSLGAAGQVAASTRQTGVLYGVQTPEVPACDINDSNCGFYALAHELGHPLGLIHSCDLSPRPANCRRSVMVAERNINRAILLPFEQSRLNTSWYFK